MKRSVLLFIISIAISSCFKLTPVDYSSYILQYHRYSGYLEIEEVKGYSNNPPLVLLVNIQEKLPSYSILSSGEEKEIFDELCKKNGDCTYPYAKKYWSSMVPLDVCCITPDLKKIDIYADSDFDEDHPAGSSLSDCVDLSIISYRPFIDSGYDKALEGQHPITKRMDLVTEKDLSLLTRSYKLIFRTAPADPTSQITFTVRSENVEGQYQQGSITCSFNDM